jgi:hypothetical protein
MEPLCKKLGKRATLKLFADADHSFLYQRAQDEKTRRFLET